MLQVKMEGLFTTTSIHQMASKKIILQTTQLNMETTMPPIPFN